MRITLELGAEPGELTGILARLPGQSALLSGGDWSVPVIVRAIAGSSGDEDDEPEIAGGLLGPGFILEDNEEWAAVIRTYSGEVRLASPFLSYADTERLLKLGLEETGRRIEQAVGDELRGRGGDLRVVCSPRLHKIMAINSDDDHVSVFPCLSQALTRTRSAPLSPAA